MPLYYTRLRPVGLGTIPKVAWQWVEQPALEAFRPQNRFQLHRQGCLI